MRISSSRYSTRRWRGFSRNHSVGNWGCRRRPGGAPVDYAAARQFKSNLVAPVNRSANPSPNARSLASRLGLATFDATQAARSDDIEVRLKAWEGIANYNEALAVVASRANTPEVESAVNGFLGSLQKFPGKAVANMAGGDGLIRAAPGIFIFAILRHLENGRGGEIRTHDLLYPKQARYQATLRPDPECQSTRLPRGESISKRQSKTRCTGAALWTPRSKSWRDSPACLNRAKRLDGVLRLGVEMEFRTIRS